MKVRYALANDKQLWNIMKSDPECPLHLLEGVFQEASERGLIRQYILAVVKKKFGSSERAQELLKMTHEDIIQTGYEGAIKALKQFNPGKGVFTSFLYLKISQVLGQTLDGLQVQKRQGDVLSYDETIGEDKTFEYYLKDQRHNTERAALDNIHFEQLLSLLSPVQKDTFMRMFQGYTYTEIAEQLGTKKSTISERIKTSFIKMTGQNINLAKLGVFERASFKEGA
jgi:RNA polymerase sigma factor (sigma-70 family)